MKSIVVKLALGTIVLLLVITIVIGAKSYSDYRHRVNDVLEYTIYSNLNTTQQQLINLRDDFKKYGDEQIPLEELQAILHEADRDYFIYSDYTSQYGRLDQRFSYLDYSDLSGYMMTLRDISPEYMSIEDIQHHKDNLQKIIKVWAPLNFNASDNYIKPKPELKELMSETNKLAADGMKKIEDRIEAAGE